MEFKIPKKLIEVALPLDDINEAAAKEKSIRQGHPSTMHLWWARRPLAVARAILFAQLVNDPGYERNLNRGVNRKEAERKREEYFEIIRELVQWSNSNNKEILNRAYTAIIDSWKETCQLNRNHPEVDIYFNPERLPEFHDPFSGGGAIPLEAKRLGLKSTASDLNPVAVMLNKAMIELASPFESTRPLKPETGQHDFDEHARPYHGLSSDVNFFGRMVLEKVQDKFKNIYPDLTITESRTKNRPDLKPFIGQSLPVIAWIWARTVETPNPAFPGVHTPLVSSFVLSKKAGKEAYVEPIIFGDEYKFVVRTGRAPEGLSDGTVGRKGAKCLLSGVPIPLTYIRSQGKQKRIGQRLMAMVLDGPKGRIYLQPEESDEALIEPDQSSIWRPNNPIEHVSGCTNAVVYGYETFGDLFTDRQAAVLNAFAETISSVSTEIRELANKSSEGNTYLDRYAQTVTSFLAFALGKAADYNSAMCSWISGGQTMRNTFGRQALPMVWDFAEANILGSSTGSFVSGLDQICKVIKELPVGIQGVAIQQDAATQDLSSNKVVSTDPPYYDNIPYAVLSDFFYVWMRRALKNHFPEVFPTITVPKAEELVAAPYRTGSKSTAEEFFLSGMSRAMHNISLQSHPAFPVTIYYAFKQSETKDGNTSSTGWESFLEAVIQSGLIIVGTWPVRTEGSTRMRASGSNALASSIVLVCQKRLEATDPISRREFQRQLRDEMPEALQTMIGGDSGQSPIAPVDLAQSAIGPGMAIYSRHSSVLNQDGSKMSVKDALTMINREISEFLNPDSANFDPDTLFCNDWFAQFGWSAGLYGEAEILATAKNTTVGGVADSGVALSGGGKVKLLRWAEYPQDWDPRTDDRTPVWEACHQLIRALNEQGETAAGSLLARMPEQGEPIRQLAYHLYTLCERKKWAEDARAYNELIGSWHAIVAASHEAGHKDEQIGLEF